MPNTRQMSANVYLKKKFQFTVIKVLFIMTCVLDRQVGDSPKELQKLNRVNPTPNYPVFYCVYIPLENTNYNADRSINLDTRYCMERPYNYKIIPSFAAIYRFEGAFLHTLASHSDLNPRPFNYSRNSVNILSLSQYTVRGLICYVGQTGPNRL